MNFLKIFLVVSLLSSLSLFGANELLLNEIDVYIQAQVTLKQFNGTVLVAKGGNIILSKGYGYANPELLIPCTPQTQFCIASCTKSFTALAIMMLQAQGKLAVTDLLAKYFPEISYGKQVTLHHLLTHSSGIIDYGDIDGVNEATSLPFDQYKNRLVQPMSFDQLIYFFKEKPLLFQPGKKMSYSNSNYVLLGSIIEKVSGVSYEKFLYENIFAPFKMHASGCDYYATEHAAKTLGFYFLPHVPARFDMGGVADGNIYSTVEDLYLYDRALRKIEPAILEQMFTPWIENDEQPNPEIKAYYGYGWVVDSICGHRRIHHSGGFNGFASWNSRFVDDDVCIIILSNSCMDVLWSIEQINNDLAQLVFTGACAKPHQTWKSWLTKWCAAHSIPRWIMKKCARIFYKIPV